jgi:response regulator RpfG family c-di-GMP phosphodiesterase
MCHSTAMPSRIETAPVRYIVVDDHESFRVALRGLLDDFDEFACIADVADGAAAREVLEAEPVDLVILDVNLAHENGVVLAGFIRESYPEVQIVLCSTGDRPQLPPPPSSRLRFMPKATFDVDQILVWTRHHG